MNCELPKIGSLMRIGGNSARTGAVVLLLEYERFTSTYYNFPQRVKVLRKEEVFWAWTVDLKEMKND